MGRGASTAGLSSRRVYSRSIIQEGLTYSRSMIEERLQQVYPVCHRLQQALELCPIVCLRQISCLVSHAWYASTGLSLRDL